MAIAAPCLLAIGSAALLGARVNFTGSMPRGLWVPALPDSPFVSVCLSESMERFAVSRGYLGAGNCPGGGWPELKRIAARYGDDVAMSPDGIAVNGKRIDHTRPLQFDSAGRPLRAFPAGTYCVKPGEIWVVAPVDRSFDSRYYGPLLLSEARPMKPFLVW